MIAVDTNIVIRLLTKDDPVQYAKSHQLFSTEDIFIADTVFLESEWVLRYAYGFRVAQISVALGKLCGLPNVTLDNPDRLARAIAGLEAGLDFADALHLAAAVPQCDQLLTFDQRYIKRASSFSPIPVRAPD